MREIVLSLVLVSACGVPEGIENPFLFSGKGEGYAPDGFDGNYLFEVQSITKVRNVETGVVTDYETSFEALAAVTQQGESVFASIKPCAVKFPEVKGLHPSFRREVIAALPHLQITGTLKLSSDGSLVHFRTERFPFTMGLNLQNPLSDPLPTSLSDRNPGATIYLTIFGVVVAVRTTLALQADIPITSIDGYQRIEGVVDGLTVDWRVYDDYIPLYDAAKAAEEAKRRSRVLRRDERFLLTRTTRQSCL